MCVNVLCGGWLLFLVCISVIVSVGISVCEKKYDVIIVKIMVLVSGMNR